MSANQPRTGWVKAIGDRTLRGRLEENPLPAPAAGIDLHRYTTRAEKTELTRKQAPIGRAYAIEAALILLRKRAEWWALTQDERRTILEEDSHHIAIGMRYLPAVARRLLHCRDLAVEAPFDFIGSLDFAPESAAGFDRMMDQLRATREWSFMDRETEIRLIKTDR